MGNMKERIAIICLIVIVGLLAWGCQSIKDTAKTYQQQTKVITKIKYVFVPKLVEVVKEIEVIKEVEKIVEVPRELREFESLEELEEWRDDRFCYIFGEPYLKVTKYSPIKDCDDVAETWQRQAIDDGFLISMQITYNGKIGKKRVTKATGWHMGCITYIGNDLYYMDTYEPYEITKIGIRDKQNGNQDKR